MTAALRVVPVTLRQANAFVAARHRHNKPARGCVFCIGLERGGELCGVAIIARPVAAALQDGRTLEARRVCTDGTDNACSKLYGVARRVAFILGYRRLVTYTLPEEGGASLRGAGFEPDGVTRGGSWNREGRPRGDHAPTCPKVRWMARAE